MTLDFGAVGLDATNDDVVRQCRLQTERPVEEMFQLAYVDEGIVVSFQEKIGPGTVAGHPLETHDVLQRQIAVVVHKVALHQVTVLVVFQNHLPLRLGAFDAVVLNQPQKNFS